MQSYRSGVLFVVAAGVAWSLMGPVIRMVDAAGTWQILFYRSLGMVPVLALVIAVRSNGQLLSRIRQAGWAGIAGGLSLVMAFSGAIFAIQSTTIANAVFLFTASPFLAAVLGWVVLREKVRATTWIAIAIAGIGVALMVREGLAAGAGWGNLAALLSALGFAAYTVALRRGKRDDMMPATLLGGVFAIVAALAVLHLRGEPLAVSLQDALWSMFMGSVVLSLGMVFYTIGSRSLPAAETTLLSLIEVLLAPVWAWLLLRETASSGTFAGGGIVLAALVFNAVAGAGGTAGMPPAGVFLQRKSGKPR